MNDQSQIFLRRFPEGEGRWQISSSKGSGPRWNRAGDRLFYVEDESLEEGIVIVENWAEEFRTVGD